MGVRSWHGPVPWQRVAGVTSEDELAECINLIEATVRDVRIFVQNKQYTRANTLLHRIERYARQGTYCVGDIEDFI